jgi:membrane-bound serine protease (ClpP class)
MTTTETTRTRMPLRVTFLRTVLPAAALSLLPTLSAPPAARADSAPPPAAPPAKDPKDSKTTPANANAKGKAPVPISVRGKFVRTGPVDDVPAAQRKVWVLVCDGVVDPGLADWIKSESREALKAGATHIVYQIDTYGGLVKSAIDIIEFVTKEVNPKAHTIAYVPDKAISAGSMFALSCRDLFIGPHGKVGDSAPISPGMKLEGVEREKIETVIRAAFRSNAQANGWPELLCEAMVTGGEPIFRVFDRKAGRYEYFRRTDLPTDAERYDLSAKRMVVGERQLLTLTAGEAYDYGFAEDVVDDVKAVTAHYGVTAEPVTKKAPEREDLEVTQMKERFGGPFAIGTLLTVGIIALLIGLKVGELQILAIGVGAFGLFFWVQMSTGYAEGWEVMLAVLGAVCILIEILYVPTMGGLLVAGAFMFIAGILLCLLPPFSFGDLFPSFGSGGGDGGVPAVSSDVLWALIQRAVLTVLAALTIGIAATAALLVNLHRIPYLRGLVLTQTLAEPAAEKPSIPLLLAAVRLGERGTAETALRPVGKVRFGERLLEVVSDGAFLSAGDPVEVIIADPNRIVVRKA